MNYLIVISAEFRDWPLRVMEELTRIDSDAKFNALVLGGSHVQEYVKAHATVPLESVHCPSEYEAGWLKESLDEVEMSRRVAMLKDGAFERIVLSDRHVGRHSILGADTLSSALADVCEDEEMRKRYVYGLLRFIFEIFDVYRPDVVFCYGVAEALPLALWETAGSRNIPFVCIPHCKVEDRHLIDTSIAMLEPIAELYETALVNPEAEAYLERFRREDIMPDYTYRLPVDYKGPGITELLKDAVGSYRRARSSSDYGTMRDSGCLKAALFSLSCGLRARSRYREDVFLESGFRSDRPYVYFSLHVEPEASTMVLAPHCTDQLAIIRALTEALPSGMSLVVKEHFPMVGRRPKGFYEAVKKTGAVLVSPVESSRRMIMESAVTVVITGTPGWEALLLKKPVVCLARNPYLAIESGATFAKGWSDLAVVLRNAISVEPADDESILRYLSALMEESFKFPNHLYWGYPTAEEVCSNGAIAGHMAEKIYEFATADKK